MYTISKKKIHIYYLGKRTQFRRHVGYSSVYLRKIKFKIFHKKENGLVAYIS